MSGCGFLAAWPAVRAASAPWPQPADAQITSLGGRALEGPPGLKVFIFGELQSYARRLGQTDLVLGALFCAPPSFVAASPRLTGSQGDAVARARDLLGRYWGGYVALLHDEGGSAVLRDPSGALEALVWTTAGWTCAASSLEIVPSTLRPTLAVDWDELGAQVADRLRVSARAPLRGLDAVAPGALRRADGASLQLWTPASRVGGVSLEPSAEPLRDVVTGCVAAWGSVLRRPLVEISGGLDSAIVTAALGPATRRRAASFVNHVVEEAGADERRFARTVAERWALALVEEPKPEARIDPDDLLALGDAVRPAFNGADSDYERAVLRLASERQADAVVTGQGGDAVFLTLRHRAVAVDLLRRRGWRALRDGELAALARWTQTSVWSLPWHAWFGRRRRSPDSPFASLRSRELARGAPPHPWIGDARRLSAARRMQIEGLTDALIFQGDSLRARRLRVVHPLISQPILEVCLALPVDALVRGGRDRGLAREAFRSALPPPVLDRTTKGDMTAYYGRMVARSLNALRPFLLEGRLAQAGLLDLERLDGALTCERLAADGGYGDIMDLATQEAWARRHS